MLCLSRAGSCTSEMPHVFLRCNRCIQSLHTYQYYIERDVDYDFARTSRVPVHARCRHLYPRVDIGLYIEKKSTFAYDLAVLQRAPSGLTFRRIDILPSIDLRRETSFQAGKDSAHV